MANIKFTNFARTALAVGVGSGDVTMSVTGGTGALFPALTAGQYFYATLENATLDREIVKITARATDTLTVIRGQDNTTARAWVAGDIVSLRLNAAAIEESVAGTLDQLLASSGASLVGYLPAGTGAVATTVQAKLRESVSVKDFGATGDGVTDDSAAIQLAINATGGAVYFPNGTYICANLQVKTGLRLHGESHLAILKLIANATAASYNGSVADSNGFYPGNVIASTLNHNGGTYSDGGTRALDEANSSYIFENIIVENLTIDGNKAANQVGDLGLNRSAMGAGVSIHQCKNFTVRGCRIINHRLDGVHIGYTLHGGSDYCNVYGNHFEGNQRTNIAMITGKYNDVHGNTGTAPTGGTSVNAGAALDIEANFADEVNYRHTIYGNRLGGSLGIVAQAAAKLQDTAISGNVWKGGLSLSGNGMDSGVVISGDTFIAAMSTDDWLTRYGPNTAGTANRPTIIKGCTVSGFARVMKTIATGGQENLVVEGCSFKTESFGQITRGYKIQFIDNQFTFTGNADAATIYCANTLGATVPNQGQIEFTGNKFYGVSNATFFSISRDASWPVGWNDYLFTDNDVQVTGATYTFGTCPTLTIDNNRITAFKPFNISSLSFFRMVNNDIRAAAAENLFANQSSTFNDVEISGNDFMNITLNPVRPKDVTIVGNRIVDGYILISYTFTSGGIGRTHVAFNRMTAKSVLANAFVVTTGSGFSTADFAANDQYKYNTNVGYTAAANIAAAVAGKYDGTFV